MSGLPQAKPLLTAAGVLVAHHNPGTQDCIMPIGLEQPNTSCGMKRVNFRN